MTVVRVEVAGRDLDGDLLPSFASVPAGSGPHRAEWNEGRWIERVDRNGVGFAAPADELDGDGDVWFKLAGVGCWLIDFL